jgi:predicted ester cyclase
MSKESENKAIVARWSEKLWGNPADLSVVDELGAEDIVVHYPLHGVVKGRSALKAMIAEMREAFPDLNFWAVGDPIAEGDYVAARWDAGGTHTGPAFGALPVGSLPAATGKAIRFTGTTVYHIVDGKVKEEIGEEGALTALQQLGLVPSK